MDVRDAHGLRILSRDECFRLLATHPIHLGRLAFVVSGVPMVLPVNYELDRGALIFKTGLGTKLNQIARGAPVAFEVDDVAHDWQGGWSVVVQGFAEEVTDTATLEQLHRLSLRSWAPGQRSRYVRIRPEHVTGRAIELSTPAAE